MPNKAFLEITNACNLSCSFCHGTRRPIRYMTVPEFETAAGKLRTFADYLYFHLMGEPFLHPKIGDLLRIAGDLGFKVILTTNGTLLEKRADVLFESAALHKVSISLHSFEANAENRGFDEYLESCFAFCREASQRGIISVMRLWNNGGDDRLNGEIISRMESFFGEKGGWKQIYSGYKIAERVFLEWGDKFDWPDEGGDFCSDSHSCYGLRDQIGVLSDGSVVPCCLDAEGAVNLGNIFERSLEEILTSPRAVSLKRSFETRHITEPLCQRCGYAKMRYKK